MRNQLNYYGLPVIFVKKIMAENYDNLDEQIGDLGGEKKPKLGKLKNAAAYGKQENLTESEEKSLEEFLSKNKEKEEVKIEQGWIPIEREMLGIRSIFYPADWQFYVRPATLQAIKSWTAIDEERPDQLNKVFNDIIRSCVKISDGSGVTVSWGNLNSWDRFWFILKVREYTFVKGESKIEFEDSCSECDTDILYHLTSDSLFYEFPDDDLVEKYWDGKAWKIDPHEYDVDHEPITLYTPTLAKEEAIINWAIAKQRNKQKIDEQFVKYLLWMMNKPAKDEQMIDRQIQKLYKEYKSWDFEVFSFISDVITNITINQSEKLRCTCPSCGQEATSTVQFPNGVKVLFEVRTKAKKFGSR